MSLVTGIIILGWCFCLTGFKLWLEYSGHNFDFHYEPIVTQSKIGLQWTAWFNLGLKTELF